MASVVSPQPGFLRRTGPVLQRLATLERVGRLQRIIAQLGARLDWVGVATSLVVMLSVASGCDPLPDCYTDQDCDPGLTCVVGECVQPCSGSSVCGAGGECHGVYNQETELWTVDPRCETDPVCDCPNSSDTCVEIGDSKACVQVQAACTFRSCDQGYECVPTAGSSSCSCSGGDCGPRCSSGKECTSGMCSSGRCETRECDANDDCGDDLVCVIGVDGRGSCELSGDVKSGQTCTSSSLCASGHCTLLDGSTTCQTTCEKDSQCSDDERCARDATYEASGGGTCVSESFCGKNRPVISSGTVACGSSEGCETDTDCPAPGTCVLGQCTCPAGTCEQSCDGDDDCATGLTCSDDTCSLPKACSSTDDCSDDDICATNPAQRAAGKHCVAKGSVPVGQSCEAALDCASGFCIDGQCEVECETTADCSEEDCTQRSLTGGSFALLCSPRSCDCEGEEVCLRDGTCARAKSCLLDACSEGESCIAGVCRTSCESGADCDDGQTCTLSPPDDAYYCALNDCACSADQVCLDGDCVDASACRLDADCDSGVCLSGQCQTACEAQADCGDRECLATVTTDGVHLLCGSFGCGCASDSWCDPSGATPQCYRGVDCDGDCDDGFVCSTTMPANYFAGTAPLVAACQCEVPLVCGKPCQQDDECATGESCSARGTCAPADVCELNSDCGEDEDCVLPQNVVLADTTNSTLLGTCREDACGCKKDDDVCVESDLASACVSLGKACSVLENSCTEGYRCDATLGLCACDDPEECGGGCSDSSDCAPDRLCERSQCVIKGCQTSAECPEDSICGGPTRNRCVQPGTKSDFEVCSQWFECESAYCFANNTCATPCEDTGCSDDLVCQMFEPLEFPNERPICVNAPGECNPACEPGQYCDNAADAGCQPIQL